MYYDNAVYGLKFRRAVEEVKIQGGKVLDACNEVQIQVAVLVIFFILTISL